MSIVWHPISDFYVFDSEHRCRHRKDPPRKWIRLSCVYKIKINDAVVHVGRSDTCKKHGPAEKVRKAIVQLLGLESYNPSVATTKLWREIRLQHRPNSSNIHIGVIETKNVQRIYAQESQRTN
jgi:hypothetical protein